MRALLFDIVRLTIWLAILAAIFVPLERLFALRPQRRSWRTTLEDLGFYFFTSLVPALIMAVPLAALVKLCALVVPATYYGWVAGLPLSAKLAASLIIGEVGFYWGHRLAHASPFLWQYHAVHHRPAQLDWLVNTRAHPVDFIFERLCGLVPLYLLGLAGTGGLGESVPAMAVIVVGTLWGFFIHANLRWRLGPLEHLVATPFFHHWHHSAHAPLDRNFAAMLPFVDRLFGTFHGGSHWPAGYGLSERGVANTLPPPTQSAAQPPALG